MDQIYKSALSHKNYSVIFPEQEVWKTVYQMMDWNDKLHREREKSHLHEQIFSQLYYSFRHALYSPE